MKYRLLWIDDEEVFLLSLKNAFEKHGFEIDTGATPADAIAKLTTDPHAFSLVILDYRLGDRSGAVLAEELRQINPDLFVLILSGDPSREALKATWKSGAVEFIDKNTPTNELMAIVTNWCKKYEETLLPVRPTTTISDAEQRVSKIGMVGRSVGIQEVATKVEVFKGKNRDILVLGESGTGKEMVARALHAGRGHFRALNCASYRSNPVLLESALFGHMRGAFTGADRDRKGIFEEVAGGVVFLDEIHHLSPDVQASLLRTLQERKVIRAGSSKEIDVQFRLIAAAKPNIEVDQKNETFRPDLYYRIKGAAILIPPLRHRKDDIEPLVVHFTQKWIAENRKSKVFLARTVRYLERYDWPGNVRELQHTVYELLDLIDRDKILPEDLDSKFFAQEKNQIFEHSEALEEKVRYVEVSHIKTVIGQSRSLRDAARRMAITPQKLLRLLKKHGMHRSASTGVH